MCFFCLVEFCCLCFNISRISFGICEITLSTSVCSTIIKTIQTKFSNSTTCVNDKHRLGKSFFFSLRKSFDGISHVYFFSRNIDKYQWVEIFSHSKCTDTSVTLLYRVRKKRNSSISHWKSRSKWLVNIV